MKLKLRAKLILCSLMSILTIGTLGVFSHAVHADDTSSKGDYVISITPAQQKVGELQPGQNYAGTFTVFNNGNKEINFKVYTTGYQVTDENYSTSYTDGNFTTISKWITFSQNNGSLAPGERQEIKYTIKVPQDAPAGGQYAAIMVENVRDDDGGNDVIATTSRLAMIIYSHVAGNTINCAKIHSTNINTFLTTPPISATALVENCGNIDIEAEYTLKVYPLFSDEEAYTNEENPVTRTILPETKRFNTISWDNSPAFGIFRVEETVKIGDQTETKEATVILCPLWLIVLIILFIGAVVFWFIARSRERKNARARSARHSNSETQKSESEKGTKD